jgi:guanylate kinase
MDIVEFCGHSGSGKSTLLAELLEESIFDSKFKVLTDLILGNNKLRLKLQIKKILQFLPCCSQVKPTEYQKYINYGMRRIQQNKAFAYQNIEHQKLVEFIKNLNCLKQDISNLRDISLALNFASYYYKEQKGCSLYLDEGLFQLFEPILNYNLKMLERFIELYPVKTVIFINDLGFEETYERLKNRDKKTTNFIQFDKEEYRQYFERQQMYFNWLKRELPKTNVKVLEFKNDFGKTRT